MKTLLDPRYGWRQVSAGDWQISVVGSGLDLVATIAKLPTGEKQEEWQRLGDYLNTQETGWAFVAWSSDCTVAAVDAIRSYPIFYAIGATEEAVSNSARLLYSQLPIKKYAPPAVMEFSMAGYVTGRNTLVSGVHQLQAGELLVASSSQASPIVYRYYRYLPQPEEGRSLSVWIDELAETTEGIFRRLVKSADGRQLLVPLSGGLDSRLIVCMLRHLGCDNVRTFSYGPHANYEAKIAKIVARKVGYPWKFVPTTHAGFREYFWSSARKDYWSFSDGLCAIPNMQDIYPLLMLRETNTSEDSIIVNGQSGDFISGGHIPARLFRNGSREALLEALLDKHFALRGSLRTPANTATVAERINESLREMEAAAGKPLPAATLYESWEWQERQCKYVIGGQRIYDWLAMDWRLPLWDADYLKFWSRVPFELKLDQRLYKEYLYSRDYCGLFRNFSPTVWRWPGATMAVLPAAQLIGLLGGRRAKDRFYAYARYIGHYGPNYAPWGWHKFSEQAIDVRNALPFFIETWMEESGIRAASDTYLRRAMS
jgi:asparagine synthase (glutamine-hydrolysing)